MTPIELTEALKNTRKTWDTETKEWWYPVLDIIELLTEDDRPSKHWRQMLQSEEGKFLLDLCKQFPIKQKENNRATQTDCVNQHGLLRILQSIPSKTAEPLKQWLAKTGALRWKKLKMELNTSHIKFEKEWADALHQGAFDGLTVQDHLKYKQIKAGNIRDHLTGLELAFLILGEVAAEGIIQKEKLKGRADKLNAAKRGAQSASYARKAYELASGHKVISRESHL